MPGYDPEGPVADLTRLAASIDGDGPLPGRMVLACRSMGDWLLAAALRHPSGGQLRSLAGAEDLPLFRMPAGGGDVVPWDIRVLRSPAPEEAGEEERLPALPDPVLVKDTAGTAPMELSPSGADRIPSKLAATELSRGETDSAYMAGAPVPPFLSESGLTPAERGTALHTFMQFARYDAAADSPEGERNRAGAEGFLTVQQGEALPFAKIRAFFGGSLYRRMEGASRLWREVPFTVAVSPHLLTDEAEELEGESVIVQGIADCVFEEDGQLVIVDYKTDRVKTGEELVGRYRDQLGIYAYALAQTLGLPVRECLLYSFALSRTVPVPPAAFEGNGLDAGV